MLKTSIQIILFVLVLHLTIQTSYTQQWVKIFGGFTDDKAVATITDLQGNIYVTGYTTRPGTGVDFCTNKYAPNGTLLWTAYYDGPNHTEDRAFGIAVDASGTNVYITGYSTGLGSMEDYTTIKYNTASGTQQWVARYNGTGNNNDRSLGIVVDRFNNVYVTGYITGTGRDIYTIKWSSNGAYLWGQSYNGNANSEDRGFGIAVDAAGTNLYITGFTTGNSNGTDMTTIKYDSSGVRKWVRIYNGSDNKEDKAFGIVLFNFEDNIEDGIYVTGYTTNTVTGADYTTIKYNTGGSQVWVSKYRGEETDKAFGIVIDQSGNSYVTGFSENNGQTDYMTLRINLDGDTAWTKRYNGPGNGNDTAYAIALSDSRNLLYITGSSQSVSLNTTLRNQDAVSIKYDAFTGNQLAFSRYNGVDNKHDAGLSLTVDTSNNVTIAGYTQSNNSSYDMLVMRFLNGDLIKVNTISTSVPKSFQLYQNYPNPFNPTTKIRFDITKSSFVSLIVYDVTGREAAKLVNEYLKFGSYEVEFNIPKIASGIYFYELYADGYRKTKTMALIK